MWTCMQWSRKDIATTWRRKDIATTRRRKDIATTWSRKDIATTRSRKDNATTWSRKDIATTRSRKDTRVARPLWREYALLLLVAGLHNYQVNAVDQADLDQLKFEVIYNDDPYLPEHYSPGGNYTVQLKVGDIVEGHCEFRAAVNPGNICPGNGEFLQYYETGNEVKCKIPFVFANLTGANLTCEPATHVSDEHQIVVNLVVTEGDLSKVIHDLIELSANNTIFREKYEIFPSIKEAMKGLKPGQLDDLQMAIAQYKRNGAGTLTVEGITDATKAFVKTQKPPRMNTENNINYTTALGTQTLKLECEYERPAVPPVLQVKWFLNKTLIFGSNAERPHEKYSGSKNMREYPSLNIKDVSYKDQGLYECHIINWAGTSKIMMRVKIPPKIKRRTEDDGDAAITLLVFGCVLIVGGMCLVSWSSNPGPPPKKPPPPPPPPPPPEEDEDEEEEEEEEGEG